MTLHLRSTSQLKRIVLTEGGQRENNVPYSSAILPPLSCSPEISRGCLNNRHWMPRCLSVSVVAGAHWRWQGFCAPGLSVPAHISAQPEDGCWPRPRCVGGCSSSGRCSGTGVCPILAKWGVLKGCYSLECRLLWCEFILQTGSCRDPALAASCPCCESERESLSDSWLCLKNKWQVSNIFPYFKIIACGTLVLGCWCTSPGQSGSSFLYSSVHQQSCVCMAWYLHGIFAQVRLHVWIQYLLVLSEALTNGFQLAVCSVLILHPLI